MAEGMSAPIALEAADDAVGMRVYEIGYHISSNVKEDALEKVVGGIRAQIEKAGGSFIAEGAPSLTRLSYGIEGPQEGEGAKRIMHDRAYFGWIKFESSVAGAHALETALKNNADLIRFILFRTVREDTRAKMKPPTLREVKRTDVIKAAPRRAEEAAAPVSEEELEKALQDLTAE